MPKNTILNKIFIIGLPRTSTTSICSKFLALGFSVAHTAYTENTFEQAQVIADTPIFSDFERLDNFYPKSKFIYLERDLSSWLPSIKQLLQRMFHNIQRNDGGFNPYIKHSYQTTFSPFTDENIMNERFLEACYLKHQSRVLQYFKDRPKDLLTIDISHKDSLSKLLNFLSLPEEIQQKSQFEKLNIGGKVTAWKDLQHPNKIESTKKGRITPLNYKC
jgi:hypothetical protein